MAATSFRGAYEFDPESYDSHNAGDLLGRLLASVQPDQNLLGNGSGSNPIGAAQFDPNDYDSPQGGLLGRLMASQSEQGQYQPSQDSNGQTAFAPQSSNVAQGPTSGDSPARGQQAALRRVYIYAPMQHDAPTAPAPGEQEGPTDSSNTFPPYDSEAYSGQDGLLGRLRALQTRQQYQPTPGNDAQPQNPDLRRVSPRSLASGAGGPAPPETSTFDPLDIAKSLGDGVANGVVNTVGLPADALTALGYPSDWAASHGSDSWRRWIEEKFTTKFYQPKSRAAGYAETIGEMVPMVLGGEGAGVLWTGIRGGRLAARLAAHDALRELPWTLAKHAVAPGVAVRALEEALPESKFGPTLQKAYPAVRSDSACSDALSRQADCPILISQYSGDSFRTNGDGTTNS